MHKVILVMGPHRESARLIPLYFSLEKLGFSAFISAPSTRDAVIEEMLTFFGLKPDIEIRYDDSKSEQAFLTDELLKQHYELILRYKPSVIVTEGHSILSFAASLAASYHHIPVCHLESDSRMLLAAGDSKHTHRDMHRGFMRLMATYHFASTPAQAAHILAQGIRRDAVFCVGDSYVDLLKILGQKMPCKELASGLDKTWFSSRFSNKAHQLLVSLQEGQLSKAERETLFMTLSTLLDANQALSIVLAVENVESTDRLSGWPGFIHERVFVRSPGTYQEFISLVISCDSVVTDCYDLHEDAVFLDKPVIFLRTHIDRVETIWAGLTYPTGVNGQKILDSFEHLLTHYKPGRAAALYGQGDAADKIATVLATRLASPLLTHSKHYSPKSVL